MGTGVSIFADGFSTTPWWWEWAPPTAEGAVRPPRETEVAVIGSGYGGLSCALELARSGVQVHVLEADDVLGPAASTRNGGGVSSGTNLGNGSSGYGKSTLAERVGPQRAAAMTAEAAQGFGHLMDLIEREGIDCRYWPTGRFVGAATPKHYDRMAGQAEQLQHHTEAGVSMLPRERQREQVKTDRFYGGMLVERSGRLHPALLHRGIRDAAQRAGATMSVGSKVTAVSREGAGFVLQTRSGDVHARDVVATTNGYTGPELDWFRRRLMPLRSYMIATEELPEDQIRALIPHRRTIGDTKWVLSYLGQSQDCRRILYGGRASFAGDAPEDAAHTLHRMMTELFPELATVKITHAWTGYVAFTFDSLPHLGQHDGIHYALGCNGSGVVNMTWLATQLARKIAGTLEQPSAFDTSEFPTRPFYTGDPWFMRFVGDWYRARDRIDRAQVSLRTLLRR